MASRILGCGSYLPPDIVTNDQLSLKINTDYEWIRSRTGISQRHVASKNIYTSHMALEASKAAILNAAIDPKSIDLIITCTTTPDNSFPSVASKLQGDLNLGNIPSFDLQAVCSGFIYGLHISDSLIKSGNYRRILLVAAEKMSSLVDWEDRSTCILFGDGAGAVILEYINDDSGIIDSVIYSDGKYTDILYTNGGVSSNQISGKIKMTGKEVFRHAVEKMSEASLSILHKNNMTIADIDHFIPHQANMRIMDAVAEQLGLDDRKIVATVQHHANCSAASIPLALDSLVYTGEIKRGDVILLTAIGAGLAWGAALLRR